MGRAGLVLMRLFAEAFICTGLVIYIARDALRAIRWR